MKLFSVLIKTYHFGIHRYNLFVLAKDEKSMYETVYKHPLYHNDKDSEIETWDEIDLTLEINRVLN